MTDPVLAADWLASTLASDAMEGEGVLPLHIRALSLEMRVVGRVTTATMGRDDSHHFRQATAAGPSPGTVLLIAGGGGSRTACMGGIVARQILVNGFEAVITDGLVRDAAEIRRTGLQVWCRGTCPIASQQRGAGQTGGPVLFGDVLVDEGDYVIADEDGVVAWPHARAEELLARARARLERDTERERPLDEELARRRAGGR